MKLKDLKYTSSKKEFLELLIWKGRKGQGKVNSPLAYPTQVPEHITTPPMWTMSIKIITLKNSKKKGVLRVFLN